MTRCMIWLGVVLTLVPAAVHALTLEDLAVPAATLAADGVTFSNFQVVEFNPTCCPPGFPTVLSDIAVLPGPGSFTLSPFFHGGEGSGAELHLAFIITGRTFTGFTISAPLMFARAPGHAIMTAIDAATGQSTQLVVAPIEDHEQLFPAASHLSLLPTDVLSVDLIVSVGGPHCEGCGPVADIVSPTFAVTVPEPSIAGVMSVVLTLAALISKGGSHATARRAGMEASRS